jgi:hypothetical protein
MTVHHKELGTGGASAAPVKGYESAGVLHIDG